MSFSFSSTATLGEANTAWAAAALGSTSPANASSSPITSARQPAAVAASRIAWA